MNYQYQHRPQKKGMLLLQINLLHQHQQTKTLPIQIDLVQHQYRFMKQTDDYSCGPIACLKLLELFERKNYLKDMDTGMYRITVMEKLTSMLDAYEEEIFIEDGYFKELENRKKF